MTGPAGCPLSGGTGHSLFYGHGAYWCLDTNVYYSGISHGIGAIVSLVLHLLLIATVVVVAGTAAVLAVGVMIFFRERAQ